jgi:hypothetical protein
MKKCVWVRLELIPQIEFLEWTDSHHLRHSKVAGLREDKDARSVVGSTAVRVDHPETGFPLQIESTRASALRGLPGVRYKNPPIAGLDPI